MSERNRINQSCLATKKIPKTYNKNPEIKCQGISKKKSFPEIWDMTASKVTK